MIATVALTLTVGGGTITLTTVIRGGRTNPSTRTSEHSTEKESRTKADFQRVLARFKANGYKANLRTALDTDCAKHSYGRTQAFFRTTPCDLLGRAVVELQDKRKNVILVAVSRVDMPDASTAAKFKKLVDTDGTGNITELSRESGPYRNIKYDGKIYASTLRGTVVWNAQVMPALGRPATTVLKQIRAEAQAP